LQASARLVFGGQILLREVALIPSLALPVAYFLFAVLSTVFFYFFPRTIAGIAVLMLFLLKADYFIRLFDSIDLAAATVTLTLFLWLLPGLFADVRAFKTRWVSLENYLIRLR